MSRPQPIMKPGYDSAGRKTADTATRSTGPSQAGIPNRRSVFHSYQALPRPARIAISGSFFLFALAGYYYEPYVLPLPDHQQRPFSGYDASPSSGGGETVLVDAREGERVPVRLSVVDRSVTRGG